MVKVDKFIFLIDFVILDIDEDFLATSQALINVSNGRMTPRVGDDEVVFALFDAIKHSLASDDNCYFIDMTKSIADDSVQDMMQKEMTLNMRRYFPCFKQPK